MTWNDPKSKRNRIGYRARRLLRAGREKGEAPMEKPEKSFEERVREMDANAAATLAQMEKTKEAVARLRRERDDAVRAVVLAVERQDKVMGTVREIQMQLSRMRGYLPSIGDWSRLDELTAKILRDLEPPPPRPTWGGRKEGRG